MKFSIDTSSLLKKLQVISGAIGANSTLPILEDFLFELDGSKLSIAATDLDTSIIASLHVEAAVGSENGKVAIPSKILLDVLKTLPDQPLFFDINVVSNAIEISSENGVYKMVGENGEDFPNIPQEAEESKKLSLSADVLGKAITMTAFATSTDDLRPAMTGVYFLLNSEGVTFVATDAHKLVRYQRTDISVAEEASFILPRKALNLLKAALPSDNADITIAYDDTNAFFSFEDAHLVCRLIDARYPDYEAVIPTNNPYTLTVSRKDMQNALRRISIFSNKSTYQVIMALADDGIKLSAQDIDFQNEASEKLPSQYDGEPFDIAFNAKFLLEVVKALETEQITFKLSMPTKAGILTPSVTEEGEEITMLVMPIMLSH